MIKTNNAPKFGYVINKNHYKHYTPLTAVNTLLQEEVLDPQSYEVQGEWNNILTPEEAMFQMLNDFTTYERVDIQAIPDVESGTFYYYNTGLKINGQELYVAYDTETFISTPLLGIQFINHLRVQDSIQVLRTQVSPF